MKQRTPNNALAPGEDTSHNKTIEGSKVILLTQMGQKIFTELFIPTILLSPGLHLIAEVIILERFLKKIKLVHVMLNLELMQLLVVQNSLENN